MVRIDELHEAVGSLGSNPTQEQLERTLSSHYNKMQPSEREFFLKTIGITHSITYTSPDTNDPTRRFSLNKPAGVKGGCPTDLMAKMYKAVFSS